MPNINGNKRDKRDIPDQGKRQWPTLQHLKQDSLKRAVAKFVS